ncbi:aldo/keto reductase [Curtobacterium sp. MCBD17_013]|uniref:aldo/keto reductase n=1 Tax=Curtobacterium sp. MCBD17_013 TaxID=2175668 RepID=UPI000DA6F6CB|nr:aldo/keto reductase [Curtobacterium sp. MCBD17_013]PZF63839.1 aldo/keto reductase [Curtobacterium sp. MCBD17_013]
MEYRHLGNTGLQVSTISLGTMGFAGTGWASPVGHIDVDGARRQIDIARDAGVNLIDTADVYSDGASEEILGQALGSAREDVLIATKVRGGMGPGPNDGGLSRHHIVKAAEDSLRRLGTDHIDLYQLHGWDGSTPLEETLSALDDLVRSGKVRYIGASNFSGWHLMKAMWASDKHHLEHFASQQIYYSLQSRDAENELVPITLDQGIGILVWSPLAGGLLTGKYRRGQDVPEGSRRFEGWTEPPIDDEDRLYDTIEVLVDIAEQRGVTATQVGLAWTLAKPGVTSAIVGARTEEQLTDSLGAADVQLSADEIARLDDASATPLQYPYWHQANTADGRSSAADLSLIGRHLHQD